MNFATELVADASDRLILEAFSSNSKNLSPKKITIIGDKYGAITYGVLQHLIETGKINNAEKIKVNQDNLYFERAIQNNLHEFAMNMKVLPIGKELFMETELVLLRLPKSLRELREVADAIARYATAQVRVIAVGRVKHMTLQMNSVLGEFFYEVTASLAKQKSRLLFASNPKPVSQEPPFPDWGSDKELSFDLAGYGATFGGTKFDHGTRLLLKKFLAATKNNQNKKINVVDLGCGNGVVAATIAQNFAAKIVAVDVSDAAVKATKETLKKAKMLTKVEVQRANACENIPAGWADFVILNPPFHSGTDINKKQAELLVRSAAKTLKQNGELWFVMNSHLPYRAMLSQVIGRVTQVAKDKRFTVLKAIKTRK